jgi:predicted phosphodiesterase
MRIAIVSDIHSNFQALTKALSIIDELRIDEIYCLGDIVGYGGSPNECTELIRKRAVKCILGNHDIAAIDVSHAENFTRPGKIAIEWTHDVLMKENREFLATLPYMESSSLMTLAHASPAEPERWHYITSLQDAAPQFEYFTSPLCFIGHTHVPFICGEDMKTLYLKKGIRSLINVGSVGQPRDGNPQLSFGVFDTDAWTYRNIRADYDVQLAAQTIIGQGLPQKLGERLFHGM